MHQTISLGRLWDRAWHKSRHNSLILVACFLVLVLIQTGCTTQTTTNGIGGNDAARSSSNQKPRSQGNSNDSSNDQALLSDMVADGDVNNPSATALHDLAGRLLLYKATNRKMPREIVDVFGGKEGGSSTWAKPLLDPASEQPFVYTPDSARQPGLPGRIILHQPKSQGSIGRWALLFDDQSKDGKVVTYVQRVPDSAIPSQKKNAVRFSR